MKLVESLGLASARVIAICGAGGKSSLMFALAESFAAAGERVLISTTTKMSIEQVSGRWRSGPAEDVEAVCALAGSARGPVIAYHHVDTSCAKVVGYQAQIMDCVASISAFTRILIEADGSACRPLKAPASHEPVFPTVLEAVVMVAGASGLDRPLDDRTVFRPELWSKRTGIGMGDTVTPDSLATMVVHPEGLARGAPEHARRVLFVNQCDDSTRVASALRAIAQLDRNADALPQCAVLGRLKPNPRILHRVCFERKRSIVIGVADAQRVNRSSQPIQCG